MSNQKLCHFVYHISSAGAETVQPVGLGTVSSVPGPGVPCHPQQPVFAGVVDEISDHVLRPTLDQGPASNDLTLSLTPI